MKDSLDILKLWVKNNMYDYELKETKEGIFIYYNKQLVCFSKNPNVIYKAIKILGGLK
jgi:hypothetical protein